MTNNDEPKSGSGLLAGATATLSAQPAGLTVHYIADPMCSQCYGIAPLMDELVAICDRLRVGFSLTMGGLRAGGGVPWDAGFKSSLREEWAVISQISGMPFDTGFFDQPDFDYDTEPACRAVVVAQDLLLNGGLPASAGLAFFKAVQAEFYVHNRDPKLTETYRSACVSAGIEFADFERIFPTPDARQATHRHFVRSRMWEVSDFPTLLLEAGGKIIPVAQGFKAATGVLEALLGFARIRGASSSN